MERALERRKGGGKGGKINFCMIRDASASSWLSVCNVVGCWGVVVGVEKR